MTYTYIGDINGYDYHSSKPDFIVIFLHDPANKEKAPMMLSACGRMAKAVNSMISDERNIYYLENRCRKKFYFNTFCMLRKIEFFDPQNPDQIDHDLTIGDLDNFCSFAD